MERLFDGNNLLNYFSLEKLNRISQIEDLYLKAQLIVAILFNDKVDKAGKPYVGHLYRVSDKLDDPIEKVAALLHDIIEDTEITFSDLAEVGFSNEILEIVRLVTKDEIDKIINSGNIHAIRLKEADMSDNYDLDRLKKLPEEKQEWFHEKYGKQLIKLRNVKKEE